MVDHQFPRYSFLALFIALVAMILLPPFFGDNSGLIQRLVWICNLLAGLWLVTQNHRLLLLGGVFALPAILVDQSSLMAGPVMWTVGYFVISMIFLLFILYFLFRVVIGAKRVSTDLIFASLCVYLLLAVVWTYIYLLIDLVMPGAFSINPEITLGYSTVTREFMYYSVVTLTTLGYGDIIPQNAIAKSWAAMEAIVGQLYLAVIVARLMGLYIANELVSDRSEDSQS